MAEQLRVFLSSTKLDLAAAREDIIKYLGVLKSEVLAMEVSGSDESRPVEFSIAQVRSCNVFIGVYAERYGFVDEASGKSITELEYIEAGRMLDGRRLRAMLLYIIDPKAKWPLDLIEREPTKAAALQALKEQILRRHTVSFFTDPSELPFLILRDVIRKAGLVGEKFLRPRNRKTITPRRSLDRPVGMEYYGEDLSQLFFGRESELDALQRQVLNSRMSLLIGTSGVGKTSLLCAGLMHRVRLMGWSSALVRPLTDPVRNLKRFVWDQLLEGDLPNALDLPSVIRAVATAHRGRCVLIVIDQFEDVLAARDPADLDALAADLFSVFNMAEDNLTLLFCYRGEVESNIGTIWQTISGSPQGLPRTYLGPLGKHQARNVIESTLLALGMQLKEKTKSESSLLDTLLADLETESSLSGHSGVYPPFVQIVMAHFYEQKDNNGIYHSQTYYSAGQSRRIIAEFLMNQLKYLGKEIEIGKSILVALVSSYATKTQKSLEEISRECLLPIANVQSALNMLIDLRLVRRVDETHEIAHDFLAQTIFSELVSLSEREAKKFKDILASRAVAYDDTKACLTRAEHLHIYRFRNKILCTDHEARLLLASYLTGNGPVAYWAKKYSKAHLRDWTRHLIPDSEVEFRQAAYRFLVKLGDRPQLSVLAELFSDYKQQAELSRYITDLATSADIDLLVSLNRKKTEDVVRASEAALARLVTLSNVELLERMALSKSRNTMLAFEYIALELGQTLELSNIREGLNSHEPWRRLLSVCALPFKGKAEDLQELQGILRRKVPQKLKGAVTKSITRLALRLGHSETIHANLHAGDRFTVEKTLEAIDSPSRALTIEDLFSFYETYPLLTARAIYKTCVPSHRGRLQKILATVRLEPPARELVYALCKVGKEDDFQFLFCLLRDYDGQVSFWNPHAVVERISDLATLSHLPILERVINTKEFWRYYGEKDRPESKIAAANYANVYFMKRLAATAFGKIATRVQSPTVYRMLEHDYWVVRNGSLHAINRCGNANDLEALVQKAIEHPSKAKSLVAGICILDEILNIISEEAR